ncbi:antA/AntB antirepressor family protein [Pontibacter pamirensis]|uniref:antA/AntB antirepressor family protein n=1 Tax=Pontibacter pamirensis TaxID=2562824 RepID=UPI00138A1CDF|nr:antA/AntB antirepressor family protein [Pontibacter pamirensis]
MANDTKELIPFSEEELNGQRLVPASRLHKFLGNKKRFTDWFKHRAKKYQLEHGVDYITIATPSGEAKRGGHNAIEYGLTINAAKELSMVEGTARGKEARAYFLRKEQLANVLQNGVVQMMQQMQQRMEQLERTVQHQLTEGDSATILGYARIHHHHIPIQDAVRLGKKAAAMSRARGLEVKTVPDARFGKVNTYSVEILREIFEEEYPLL